jgi:hypothetical protein
VVLRLSRIVKQGILIEGRLSTVDLLIKLGCFEKKKNTVPLSDLS